MLLEFILRILGPNAWMTILRYILSAAGGFFVAKGYIEEGTATALQDQIIGLVAILLPTFFGAKATVTPKVVTKEGETVPMKKMPVSDQKVVEKVAQETLTK